MVFWQCGNGSIGSGSKFYAICKYECVHCLYMCPIWAKNHVLELAFVCKNSFLRNQHFLVCFRQSGTIKLTVWTVGSYYEFGQKTHFVGETLPTKSQRWISHFPSYLIIDLFLCKWWICEYNPKELQRCWAIPECQNNLFAALVLWS